MLITRQLRLVPALVRPTARATPWWALLAGAALSLALLRLGTLERPVEPGELVRVVRISTVVFALAAAPLLDDPSEVLTRAAPGSLLLRRGLRVALALPLGGAWWLGTLAVTAGAGPLSLGQLPPGPVRGLTLEAAALLAASVALAAWCSRPAEQPPGGAAAGPALLALVALASQLPAPLVLFATPDDQPAWQGAHERWLALLAAMAVAFALACRDPGGASAGRRWRSRRATAR